MIRARQLGALLLLAHVASAQTPTSTPVAPAVTNMSVSGQNAEVRIDVSATAAVTSAKVTAAYGDRIAIDVPGVVYTLGPRRIQVNKNGVHAVRIWQQSENPPLTRMLIELDRATPYVLSSEGNGIVLRIGPRVREREQRASNEPSKPVGRQNAPAATGRTSPAVSAAQAVIGVFRRTEKPTFSSQTENTPAIQPQPPSLPAPPVAQTQAPASPTVDSSKENKPSVAVIKENPPLKAAEGPKVAPVVPAPPAAEVAKSSSSITAIDPTSSPLPPPPPPVDTATLFPTRGANGEPVLSPEAVEMSRPAKVAAPEETLAFTESVNTGMRTAYLVKHVQDETAYLDGGRSSGLAEGMTLVIKDDIKAAALDGLGGSAGGTAAELVVIGVAETSAVAEIRSTKRDIGPGDIAYLSSQDTEALVDQHTLGATRKYPAVITFTESDLLDEEARAFVPKEPLPSVNRMRGRFGIDYMGTINRDSSQSRNSEIGAIFRADFTRIGGTYWNLSGYWRGRINSFSATSQPTLQDLLNRTYHLDLTYQNPNSRLVAGVGRMYLPWASSLNTIDGGYFGVKIAKTGTIGLFGGSTPDPTSWNYNPNQKIGGMFVNFEGGSYEHFHYTSTSGLGVNLLKWQMDKPFIFFENNISYKRIFSIYHSLQADRPRGTPPAVPSPGAGISQSFLTVRIAPIQRLEFSVNHTFFRDIPTFDPTLIGTGLLDKYLFQGMSAGARLEVVKQISLYTTLGESNRSGDVKRSLNQLFGIAIGRVPWLGLRADAHYSKFNSSFGGGTYRAVSLSRSFGDGFRVEVLGGNQSIFSTQAGNQSARFLTSTIETSLGSRFFLQGGLTFYRGQLQNYDQWNVTLGYRFDTLERRK
jgi:AMIN domain